MKKGGSKKKRDPPAKHWVFTINNYSDADEAKIRDVISIEASYGIYGKEIGENGTPHLQGYIIFKSKIRFDPARIKLGGQFVEKAGGTPLEASVYCKKEGDFWEFGELPRDRRKRTRDEIATDFENRAKAGELEIFKEENIGDWYYNGKKFLENFMVLQPPIERPGIKVVWLYGAAGVGKSRAAHEFLPNAYLKEPRTKWWNGYMLQKTCILDDFAAKGIDMNHLLRWFDRYKCLVEVKGSMVPLHVDQWIVTSNFHPRDVFRDDQGNEHPQMSALMRRIVCMWVDSYESAKHVISHNM